MADPGRDLLLIGATGMVGRAVLAAAGPSGLTALVRRAPGDDAGARLLVAASADWPAQIAALRPRVLLCALGTTMAAAGSRAAFAAVDHDLVLSAARAARAAGAAQMVHVSSVGAMAASSNFYLQTKAAVEAELAALGFARLDILRPGLLLGDRSGAPRRAEALGMRMAPVTNMLLPGPLRRFRAVPAAAVARAMVALAGQAAPGRFIHHHDEIMALGGGQLA